MKYLFVLSFLYSLPFQYTFAQQDKHSDMSKIHTHQALITDFYTAFANGNAEAMIACYHDDIEFHDPAFGTLKGEKAKSMWKMLLSSGDGTQIIFDQVNANNNRGSANWQATYNFGPKKRKVINNIKASFEFKDGKIIKHTDDFSMWKWSKQALGFSGHIMGWSRFFKKQIQARTNGMLEKYMNKNK